MPDKWRYLFTVTTGGMSYQVSDYNGRLKILNLKANTLHFINDDHHDENMTPRERTRHIIEGMTK